MMGTLDYGRRRTERCRIFFVAIVLSLCCWLYILFDFSFERPAAGEWVLLWARYRADFLGPFFHHRVPFLGWLWSDLTAILVSGITLATQITAITTFLYALARDPETRATPLSAASLAYSVQCLVMTAVCIFYLRLYLWYVFYLPAIVVTILIGGLVVSVVALHFVYRYLVKCNG